MTASPPAVSLDDAIRRMCAEYAEMPGLRVTCQQAQRLWGLDAATCLEALLFLTESGFLYQTQTHLFTRRSDGPAVFPPLNMAKADIRQGVSRRRAV